MTESAPHRLGKGVLKICSKYTGKHPCRCAISIKLLLKVCSKCTGEHPCRSAIEALIENALRHDFVQ